MNEFESIKNSASSLSAAQRLLSVSASLFREKGYSASSTREIAELLGISKASLYHHVDSKEDILFQICVESLRRIINNSADLITQIKNEQDIREVIRLHVIEIASTSDFHAVMLTEMRGLSPEHRVQVVAMRDEYESLIRKAISLCQEKDILRQDIGSKYLLLCLLNLLNWTIFWYKSDGVVSPDELGLMLASVYMDGAASSHKGKHK